jgi:uncharacterized membrane protein
VSGRNGGQFINLKAEVEIMALHDKLDRIQMEELEEVLRDQTQRIDDLNSLVRATLVLPSGGRDHD